MTALSDLKAHLNILDTDDADYLVLTAKLAAAVAFTNHEIGGEAPVSYDDAPADLQQAVLMLAAHWYENREASLVGLSIAEVPFGYREIVQSHRVWVC